MQSNFFRYHYDLEQEKRKIVHKVHAKRILQTAPQTLRDGNASARRYVSCRVLVKVAYLKHEGCFIIFSEVAS